MSKSWSKTTRYIMLILVLLAIIALVQAASSLIAPLAISAILAYILNPGVILFTNRTSLERAWAVLIVYLLALILLLAMAITLAFIAPNQIGALAVDVQALIEQVVGQVENQLVEPILIFGYRFDPVVLVDIIPAVSADLIRPDIVFQWFRAASTNLGWILVILVTTYYLLQDWPRLRDWFISLAPIDYQGDSHRLYLELRGVWQRYLRGQLRLSMLVGLLTGLLLLLVGMPGAVTFGILAAIFDVILTIGPLFVMITAAVVAYFAGSAFLPLEPIWFMLLVLAIFSLVQMIENIWLRPRIMGQSLNLHPGIVFVAIIASLSLAGILAALIVVPVVKSTAVIGRYIHAKIMDNPPWPEDEIIAELSPPSTPPQQTEPAPEPTEPERPAPRRNPSPDPL
jgi:predicted PurR-regulated permease PerM